MSINPHYGDLEYDIPTRDGDHDATLLKYYVSEAEKTYDIKHGLNRIPQKIQIVYQENPVLFGCDSRDRDRVTLVFFENKTTIVLRFE